MASEWAMRQRAIRPSHEKKVFATTYAGGLKVLVDGRRLATVRAAYPEGSSSYLFPHAKVDFDKGDKNVAVELSRLSLA